MAADDRGAVLAEHRHFASLAPASTAKRKLILPGERHVQQGYDLHQYVEAEPVKLEWLSASERPAGVLDDAAGGPRAGEFLGAMAQLAVDAVGGANAPKSRCCVYDAQGKTLTREHVERMKKLDVRVNSARSGVLTEQNYNEVVQADFVSQHQLTGKRVYFTLLQGKHDALRGVPVRTRDQPNW